MVLLAIAVGYMGALAFAVIWGLGFGGRTPLLHAMRGDYFGRKHFGVILGMSGFPMAIGMMATPVIVGRVYSSLFTLAGFCILAAIMILFATKPATPK